MWRGMLLFVAACSSSTTPSMMMHRADLEFEQLDEDMSMSDEDLAGADLRGSDVDQSVADDLAGADLRAVADMSTPSGDLAGAAGASCKGMHAANPALPSGTYTITPASGSLSVYCDMSTGGGGWTQVFVPSMSNLNTIALDYDVPTSSTLWSDSSEAMIAHRNSSHMILGNWATFALPADWKVKAPFQYDASDATVSVAVNGGAASSHILHYGIENFSTNCKDPWMNDMTWGRICIEDTVAPFFDGFADSIQDGCQTSADDYNTTPCAADRQFTIFIR
jgi:hypothetical protein